MVIPERFLLISILKHIQRVDTTLLLVIICVTKGVYIYIFLQVKQHIFFGKTTQLEY